MDCPVCHIPMIVVEYHKIELDHCDNCHGVWFDSGELGLLLKVAGDESAQVDFFRLPRIQSSEKKHKCPICNRKMDKVMTGKDQEVLIDVCPQEDGLWFDGGELRQVIKHLLEEGPAETDSKMVLSFLGDAFRADDKPDL